MQMEVTNRLGKCSEVAQRQEDSGQGLACLQKEKTGRNAEGTPGSFVYNSLPSVSSQREVHMVI